jgi:hypothetical protein
MLTTGLAVPGFTVMIFFVLITAIPLTSGAIAELLRGSR